MVDLFKLYNESVFLLFLVLLGPNRLVPAVNNTSRMSSIFRPAYAPHEHLWHRQQTNQVIIFIIALTDSQCIVFLFGHKWSSCSYLSVRRLVFRIKGFYRLNH